MSSPNLSPSKIIVKHIPGLGEIKTAIYADPTKNDLARVSPMDIGQWFHRELSLAKDGGRSLYVHHVGCYRGNAEIVVQTILPDFLREIGHTAKWNKRLEDNVLGYLRSTSQRLWDIPPRGKLNVLNGILDTTTLELSPHTPKFLSTFQINAKYDSSAKGTAWDKQIRASFEEDCYELAYELIAWSLLPYVKPDRLVMLYGPKGSNGKSIFLDGWEHLVGKNNVIRQELQALAEDKYSIAELHGAALCIGSDIPDKKIMDTGKLKAIISGERVQARHIYGHPFYFEPYARLVFAMNDIPKAKDLSNAYFERLLIIPFRKTFRRDPGRKAEIMARLCSEGEMSSLLNKVITKMHGLGVEECGLSEPLSCMDEKRKLRNESDTIHGFREYNIELATAELEGKDWETADDVYKAYENYCDENGKPSTNKNAFFQRLHRDLGDRIESRVVKIKGTDKTIRIITGLRLVRKDNYPETIQ